jgi:hypothetical protein
MLPNWNDRSIFSAHLFNPAFCGLILYECIKAYNNNNENRKFPFVLSFLVLPLILNKEMRDKIIINKTIILEKWIEKQSINKEVMFKTTTAFVPYTREAIQFLLLQYCISINDDGTIETSEQYFTEQKQDYKPQDFLEKSKRLGNLFQQSGNYENIYANFNIKP